MLALILIFIGIQFIRPAKNISADNTYHISTKYAISSEVDAILQNACYDCHSNKTQYPWYAEIQPTAWWLSNHVNEGKEHLNYSEFTNRKVAIQYHKLEETIEMVKEKEMPLASYTYLGLHPKAKLSEAQRELLINWAGNIMDSMKASYPADSLILKRKPKKDD